jgi:hypothetical protein
LIVYLLPTGYVHFVSFYLLWSGYDNFVTMLKLEKFRFISLWIVRLG